MTLAYTMTDKSINIVLDGNIKTVGVTNANFQPLADELGKPEPDLKRVRQLADIPAFIVVASEGAMEIVNGKVFYKRERVGGVIATRLLALHNAGHNLKPLTRFMEKLFNNPYESARLDLYAWIESSDLTLTPDGNFLAFKRVNDDYTSIHDNMTRNNIGSTPEMKPEDCDTDPTNECSEGLHFCGFGYLRNFGGSRTVILEINPEDVVAIPTDYNRQKGRAWRYKVVDEVDNKHEENWMEDRLVHGEEEKEFPTENAFGPCDVEDAEMEVDEGVDELIFEYKGKGKTHKKVFYEHSIVAEVEDIGQRGFQKKYGVPRTTLQNWLKKIKSRLSS